MNAEKWKHNQTFSHTMLQPELLSEMNSAIQHSQTLPTCVLAFKNFTLGCLKCLSTWKLACFLEALLKCILLAKLAVI